MVAIEDRFGKRRERRSTSASGERAPLMPMRTISMPSASSGRVSRTM
jgi:hypothetical protein